MTADAVRVHGQGGVLGAKILVPAYLGKTGSGAEVYGRAAARVRQGEVMRPSPPQAREELRLVWPPRAAG